VVAVVVDFVAEVSGGGKGVDTSVLGIYPLLSGWQLTPPCRNLKLY
jgi:hypothetical protein